MDRSSFAGIVICSIHFVLLFPMITSIIAIPVHAASPGRIFGQLRDGTKNNAPVGGQHVTLQMAEGENARDITTVVTNTQGSFSFTGLATNTAVSYAIYTRYQGAQYTTDLVHLDTKPVQQMNLMVYDSTGSTAKVAVVQATILLAANAQKGIISVSEFFLFKNLDAYAYVGSLDTRNGKPNALRFSLPRAAQHVSLRKGFDGYHAIQVEQGFASDAAVPPGDSQFAFSFDIPYNNLPVYAIRSIVVYPTVQLSLLTPGDMHVSSSNLVSQGLMTAGGRPYHLYQGKGLIAGTEVHVQFEGLPGSTTTPTAFFSALFTSSTFWIGASLTIMLAIIVITWLRAFRGERRS